jgi:hypothetical protein
MMEPCWWETNAFGSMMHVGLGRTHPLHVEYIHLGACLSFIQDILTEAILSHPRLNLPRKMALIKALGKIIWIQNDLFAKWHIRDGIEFAVGDDDDIVIEREGYLHGKKIIGGSDDSASDASGGHEDGATTPTKVGMCPFSGLADGVEQKLKVTVQEAA